MKVTKVKHDYVTEDWDVVEQDNILDPWVNQKRLDEGMSSVDWSRVSPCDILYCETSIQNYGDPVKRRPLVVMYKSGSVESPSVYGMQITTVPPSSGFRGKFKYKMQDWRQIGLRAQSYINYDHLVQNITDDVRNTNSAKITTRDAKGLLSELEENYNDLIRLGYSNRQNKELLDDFISYLRSL